MTNNILRAARSVTRTLAQTELSMEDSILEGAQLVVRIIEARRASGTQIGESHRAVVDVVSGLQLAIGAQGAILASHEKLAESRDKLGISPRAAGCTFTCLPTSASLRLVEKDAIVAA